MKIEVQSYSDELAEAVKSVSAAMKGMETSGVSERLVVALVKDYNQRLTKDQIEKVLRALKGLSTYYLLEKK